MQSVLAHFQNHVERRGSETAVLVQRDGEYEPVTWGELGIRVTQLGRALVALGVEPGDRVALISGTRVEWVVCDLAIMAASGVTVPVYPSNLADECQYVIDHSEASIAIVEDALQADKLVQERDRLPTVRRVVQLTGVVGSSDGWVIGLDAGIELGAAVGHDVLAKRGSALSPESRLTIIYTSGTTGRPKGVILTHANMLYEAEGVQAVDVIRQDDVQLLFLPLAHVFAKLLEVAWLATGHILAFAESITTLRVDIQKVRPTLMCGVPRVFEKFYSAVVERGAAETGLKKSLFRQALELSRRRGELELEGKSLGVLDRLRFAALQETVFRKVHAALSIALGGRMRFMLSGGGPLPKTVAWFFRDAGMELYEGYGLTESSAGTTVNPPGHNRPGTVGPPLPGTRLRLSDDGEILVQGPGVMQGYFKDEEATREVLRGGWLHTGDVGELDRDGYLRITDRKKDLIVTAGGKNVAPQGTETLLKAKPLISQAVVYGDRRSYLSALITLDAEAVAAFQREHGISSEEPHAHPAVVAEVQRLVDECNAELPSYGTIKKFAVLAGDFSQATGELTPKLSIRRRVVYAKWKTVLDGLYDEKLLE